MQSASFISVEGENYDHHYQEDEEERRPRVEETPHFGSEKDARAMGMSLLPMLSLLVTARGRVEKL